jgi:methylisocitrate lyase
MNVREQFRRLLEDDKIIIAPGCYDVVSAKIIENLGFKCAYLGGYTIGAVLGTTEPLTTLDESVRFASYITSRINTPLIVDGDAGFGDATHVTRAVRDFERAGVTAIHIEDQVFPKRAHYHLDRKYVIPMDEMVEKIRFAVQARQDENFHIIARTDARDAENAGGIEETIDRVNAYVEAGATIAMPYGSAIPDLAEAEDAIRSINAPVLLIYSEGKVGRPTPRVSQYERIGCKIVIYNITALLLAAKSTREVYARLMQTGSTGTDLNEMGRIRREVEDAIGLPDLYRIEKDTRKN